MKYICTKFILARVHIKDGLCLSGQIHFLKWTFPLVSLDWKKDKCVALGSVQGFLSSTPPVFGRVLVLLSKNVLVFYRSTLYQVQDFLYVLWDLSVFYYFFCLVLNLNSSKQLFCVFSSGDLVLQPDSIHP